MGATANPRPGAQTTSRGSGSDKETTAAPLRPHKNGKPPQSPLRRCFSTTVKLVAFVAVVVEYFVKEDKIWLRSDGEIVKIPTVPCDTSERHEPSRRRE